MTKAQIIAVTGIVACAALSLPLLEISKTERTQDELDPVSMVWTPTADTNIVLPDSPVNFPSILVRRRTEDTSSVPLRLSSLGMDVKVVGSIATTTMTLTFYNDVDRDLEGQLVFPLGEGQSISYFAMEINGEMREASIVEKAEGRRVFETIVRRNIDPGLLEWTQGNNFRARIFPIPANGYKKIVIAYDQELIPTGRSFIYMQPMLFQGALDKFELRCEVQNFAPVPHVFGDQRQTLEFKSWQDSWVAEMEETNFIASRDIAFEVPLPANLQQAFAEPIAGDSSWFWLAITPPVSEKEKVMPSRIALFWDVSSSADSADKKKEMEVLDTYFKKVGNFDMDLVLFSNEVVYEGRFKIFEGNWEAAIKKIADTPNDGGTQLGCLDPAKYNVEEGILVSDALSNFGKKEFSPAQYPMITMTSCKSADHSYLKYIAMVTNAQFINLFSRTREEAVYDLLHQPFRFISAVYEKGEISSTFPSIPSDFKRTFTLAGILKGDEATVTLNFGHGNTIVHSRKVTVKKDPNVDNGLVKRSWAQKKINELDLRFEKNKEEITALGKHFSIVTKNTSLLVLDNLEDHVQHKVRPKDPKWRKMYDERIAGWKKDANAERSAHIEQVVSDFEQRKEWWKVDHVWLEPIKLPETGMDSSRHFRGNVFVNPTYGRVDSPMQLEQNLSVSDSAVVMLNNGTSVGFSSTVSGSGATYSWSFGDADGNVRMEDGTYTVLVTDANGASEMQLNTTNYLVSKGKMTIKQWDPETPYIKKLKKVSKEKLYSTYLDLKKKNGKTPSFYLDVANYFFGRGEKKFAVRILSNLAELQLEDASVLRILAHKLKQQKQFELAAETFRDVMKIRNEEPQSYRDLGLCYAEMGRSQQAIDELCKVINRDWDGRFPGIEVIVVGEINEILDRGPKLLRLDSLDKRLIGAMPMDVRVVITWDTDASDMDLWITDPDGFVCSYSNKDTPIGGHLSNDFTGGYGPEEFIIKRAKPGRYVVQVNYFGDSRTTLSGPVTLQAEMFTNYGKKGVKKETLTLRLEEAKDVYEVGELVFSGNQ